MAEYLSPGVYVEEFDSGPTPMQGVGTSVAGFVGVAERGPVGGAPVLVTSPSDFTRKFGGYLQANEFGDYRFLAYAVQNFFANGGSKAFISRVAPPDATIAKGVYKKGKENLIEIEARNPGAWGNNVVITFTPSSDSRTQILESIEKGVYRLKNAVGFDAGDTVVLEGAGQPQYNIIKQTRGNTITFVKPFEGKVIDTDLAPKIVIKTCEMDVTVECDGVVENYNGVSLNVSAPSFMEKKMIKSDLVSVKVVPPKDSISPVEYAKSVFGGEKDDDQVKAILKGGSNGSAASITDADFIGRDNGPGERTGIQSFLDNSDVSIMAVPGIVSQNVELSLVSHCETLSNRFAVLDIPKTTKSTSDILKFREAFDSDYCALYHPWIKVFDPLDKKDIFIPPSGSVLGVYARSDNSRGVHKAPANEVIANCTGLYVNYSVGEQDLLNPKGVNLIRKFPGSGIRVWGARTASSKPLWKYINVRRLFIYLEESIKNNTNWVVFEPNDAGLWSRVKRTIELFLEGVWRSGALIGASPSDAYFVDIGPNTMTKDDIDQGKLICVIGVAPVKPAEFVIFRITQKTGE